jgi:hypothetical protein
MDFRPSADFSATARCATALKFLRDLCVLGGLCVESIAEASTGEPRPAASAAVRTAHRRLPVNCAVGWHALNDAIDESDSAELPWAIDNFCRLLALAWGKGAITEGGTAGGLNPRMTSPVRKFDSEAWRTRNRETSARRWRCA